MLSVKMSLPCRTQHVKHHYPSICLTELSANEHNLVNLIMLPDHDRENIVTATPGLQPRPTFINLTATNLQLQCAGSVIYGAKEVGIPHVTLVLLQDMAGIVTG